MRGTSRWSLARFTTVALAATALGAWALVPAPALASITIGSDLSPPAEASPLGCILSTPPCTHLGVAVHKGNPFPAESPTAGIVTGFSVKTGAAETLTFRLGRLAPTPFGAAIGSGTGPTVTLPGPGTYSFPVSLPIAVDDIVGINTSSTAATGLNPGGCFTGGAYATYYPVLPNGGPAIPQDSNSTCELLVNAVVQPSNLFVIGKLRRRLRRGTGTLSVTVPGPGKVSLFGKGVTRRTAGPGRAGASVDAAKAGVVKVPIRAKGNARRRLSATGAARIRIKVRFAPVGGDPAVAGRKVRLKLRS